MMVVIHKNIITGITPQSLRGTPQFSSVDIFVEKINFIEYGFQTTYEADTVHSDEFIERLEHALGHKVQTKVNSDGSIILQDYVCLDCVKVHMDNGEIVTLIESTIKEETSCLVKNQEGFL